MLQETDRWTASPTNGYDGHSPEPRFISRGAAEGNKHLHGGMVTAFIPKNHTLTVLLYRYKYIYLNLLRFL